MPKLQNVRDAANTVLPLDPANAIAVPICIAPVEIKQAGVELDVRGGYVANAHLGSGYENEYFSAMGLVMTALDPTGQATVSLDGLFWLCPQDGGDAAETVGENTFPYSPPHSQSTLYETTAADVGQRWIMLIGWATSDLCQPGDTIGVSYQRLDVKQTPPPAKLAPVASA